MSDSDSDYVDVLENTNVDANGSDSEVTEKTEKWGRGKDIDWLEIARYLDKTS